TVPLMALTFLGVLALRAVSFVLIARCLPRFVGLLAVPRRRLLAVPLVALGLLAVLPLLGPFGLLAVPLVTLALLPALSLLAVVPIGQEGQHVWRLDPFPVQADVLGGHVADVGVLREPADLEVVQADDAGVGGGPLPEVELTVRPDGQLVVVVVALA